MVNILQSISKTIHLSAILAILLFAGLFFAGGDWAFDRLFWSWLFRYLHVVVGIMWIGLLWYLNFVQIPNMPKFTDEQKPAITKIIAPAVLFYFRWAALATIVTGLIVAYLNGYLGRCFDQFHTHREVRCFGRSDQRIELCICFSSP